MPKLNNLLIPIIILTGIISCTSLSFVKKSDVHQQVLLHEGKNVAGQTGYTGISTKYTVNKATGKENDAKIRKTIDHIKKSKPVISDYTNTVENDPDHGEFTNVNLIEKTETPTELEESEEDNGKKDIYNLSAGQQDKKDLSQVGLAHLNLGIAYAERGLVDQAILEFQSAIEANPHHLESHVRLGTTYGLKGMTNEALSEFKKALDINLNEAVAKIVLNVFPVAANQKVRTDVIKAHINLGNAYKEKGRLKRSQLEYEKALELKPEHPIARKLLSEICYSLGTSYMENKKYDNAIDAFDKVLELNPGFPQIKDVLEKAHYNLGINYAKNGEINKAIMEFNKVIEIKLVQSNKALFETGQLRKADDSKHEKVQLKTEISNEDQGKKQIQEEIVHIKTVDTEETDVSDLDFVDQERNASLQVRGEEKTEDSNTYNMGKEKEISKESLAQFNQPDEDKIIAIQANSSVAEENDNILASTHIVPAEFKSTSGHRVFSYYITRNYNNRIGFNDAIKKYEDATRKNHYDNTAFLSLAHAYYSKAMHLDYAIARREEDAPEGNQNFLVQRYYLNDDAGGEVVSKVSSTEQTKTLDEYNMTFHNKLDNMYHNKEMFNEAIKVYKNVLKFDPNSSKTLYSLAFSFSKKGSYLGRSLRSKNNSN